MAERITKINDKHFEINVTPDYPALFKQFMHEARQAAMSIEQRLPERLNDEQRAEILRALQSPLAFLNIACCACTNTSQWPEFRDVLGEFVKHVDQTAFDLENGGPVVKHDKKGLL